MDADVIIIGAGPAGLCFAKELAGNDLQVLILEKLSRRALKGPKYDGREIALTHMSKKILSDCGIWDLMPQEKICLIKDAKVLNGTSPFKLSFDHVDARTDNIGFMTSNHWIRKAAFEAVETCANIQIRDLAEVTEIGTGHDGAWVRLAAGDRVTAKLIVAADSRFSAVRRMMGIATSMLDFGRTCIVCKMSVERPHGHTAYECFKNDKTLAVLPISGNQVSVVVTLNTDAAAAMLVLSPEQFAQDIVCGFENRLGKMALESDRFSYPLVATFAKRFSTNRFVLIGDAAVGMHPVTAHGFNLGLRGAHNLVGKISAAHAAGHDFSSERTLSAYSAEHRRACAPLFHGTNALVKLYTHGSPAARIARHGLLRLANHIPPAKRSIMNQLTQKQPRPRRLAPR